MTTRSLTRVNPETGEIIEVKPGPIMLTDLDIATITFNMQQAEKLVTNVLDKEVDYGRTPGTPQDSLWDPGASKIMNAFNSYPDYKILHKLEEDGLISTTIQSILINRESGQVVGTGIGSASTRETKYKYRWVLDPQNYGYSPDQVKTLKVRLDGNQTKYRITNPEYGELVNTIDKMAAKRADVDAAESLPGVKSALRRLFEGKGQARKQPDWEGFWGRVRQMGLLERDIHEMLDVKSLNDWLKLGKTLDDAIKTVAEKLAARGAGTNPPKEAASPTGAAKSPSEPSPGKAKRDPETLKSIEQLAKALKDDFGLSFQDQWKELNINSWNDLAITPADAYRQVASVRQ